MRRLVTVLGAVMTVLGIVPAAAAGAGIALPDRPAAAANAYGPGTGPQTARLHWGGAYVLDGVPGLGYCIEPGDADPVELPDTQWSPIAYPGSSVFSDGEMAALAYFAEMYDGVGYPDYSVNETVAAIAEVAYTSAGGVTPQASAGPAGLVAIIETWIGRYPGPWHIALGMSPPSGSSFTPGTEYTGTVTVTSATGNGVPGVTLDAPQLGGPSAGQISAFTWLAPSTDAAGQIRFQWDISAVPEGSGAFSAAGISVEGGAPGAVPPTYGPPTGSGGQDMLVSGSEESLATGFEGTVATPVPATGTISIDKTVPDAAYYGPGGAVFQIVDQQGAVVDTLVTGPTGLSPRSVPLTASVTGVPYVVHEKQAPPGYAPAPELTVSAYSGENTVATFSAAREEPVLAAQLGVKKVNAETGQPLAGASFDFRFDATDDGAYDEDLGTCTTGTQGTCQPPEENAREGWLPGWYQVTETAAPAGYALQPPTAVQDVYLVPGATSIDSVTFADQQLGSLQLVKTGNDTAYLPVTGAVFSVSGPAPSTEAVGTLTVTTGGTTNTLGGLVPGTYTLTETAPPPGYATVPPFSVDVTPGPATTTASATDPVRPGSILVAKTDSATHAPLAGATFDTRYDSLDMGTFDVDLGTCTTGAAGTCAPPPNDGSSYLPGVYQVTETAAPPGYALPTPPPTQTLTLGPAGTANFTFSDARLVAATFTKVATGNVNASELDLAGAVIDVTEAAGGPTIASCETGEGGHCATQATLVSGQQYCWTESSAPPGLAPGAAGCFTASDAQGAEPIIVSDPGMFVALRAEKVDATSPATAVAGATFDLYRVDGGSGTALPTTPAHAEAEPGQTWVARATTGADGIATFPLQLPGYAYCTVEHEAPPEYVPNSAESCTPVLSGSTQVPPPATTVVTSDRQATVTVSARKFNAADPDTGIPGAVYDLYVEGHGPPGGPPSSAPPGAVTEPGDKWWSRGTTTWAGELHFRVPAGYAWCLKEVSAPVDYLRDTGLHCTGVLDVTTPAPELAMALPETLADVTIYTHKFNALQPRTTIPGATYELVGVGEPPPGWSATPDPSGYPVPTGDWYVGTATTDAAGVASWSVPAGRSWCLHEISAPPAYELDAGWHCTGVLTTDSQPPTETVALPEVPAGPAPAVLAFTGGPPLWLFGGGLGLGVLGALLMLIGRRERAHGPGRTGPGCRGSHSRDVPAPR